MKKFGFLAAFMALIMVFMVGCSNTGGGGTNTPPNPPEPSYSTTDLVWGAQEIAETWTAGSAAGTATLDGNLVKIKTVGAYGGVKSDTFEMDFSKRVMVNIKGYTDTNQTQLVVRIRFAGHSMVSASGAYIIAENYDNMPKREMDYKNLNGDFSIDVSDAIFLYAGEPWNTADDATMIYAEGDIDDEGNEILEGDDRIGHLKFEGQKINGYLEVWCQPGTNSGLTAEDAYVAFEEINITHEDAPVVESFSVNQADMVKPEGDEEDTRPTKGDPALQLNPTIEVADGKSTGMIYASTIPDAVAVTDSGSVTFEKATSGFVGINVFPRANIAKVATIKVQVLGNLKTAAAVQDHLNGLTYTDNKADITADIESLLDSDVLGEQNASFDGEDIAGVKVYTQANNMTVLNAYDSADASVSAAATANNGLISFTAVAPDTQKDWTYSLYTVTAGKVVKGAQDQTVSQGKGAVAYRYVDGTTKVTDAASIILLWKSGTELVANRLNVKTVDAKAIAKHYTAQEIVDTHTRVLNDFPKVEEGEQRTRISYDSDKNVAKLDVTGAYADLVMELLPLSSLDFKNRSVGIIVDFGDLNDTYFTIRMYGTDAEENNVAKFSDAYYHDIPGYGYANVTTGGVWNFEVWRYHQNRQDIISAAETVTASGLRIQAVDWKQTEDTTDGYLTIKNVTYYYAD